MENEKRVKMEVSDWVTFLSSEKFGYMSAVLGSGTIFIAVIVFIATYYIPNPYKFIGIAVFVLYMGIWYFNKSKFFNGQYLVKRGRLADKFLDNIAAGNFTDKEDIQKQWLDEMAKISPKRNILSEQKSSEKPSFEEKK
jgi:hypothetical protein